MGKVGGGAERGGVEDESGGECIAMSAAWRGDDAGNHGQGTSERDGRGVDGRT